MTSNFARLSACILAILMVAQPGYSESLAKGENSQLLETYDYHVTSHFQKVINLPAAKIYPHVVDMGSWIGFDFVHVSGPKMGEGGIFQLYKGQDFYFQLTKLMPNKLVVGVNLPSTFREENSSGAAVISLSEIENKTIVSVTMSRGYIWLGEGENPNQAFRATEEFEENTRKAWEDNFLPRLEKLALEVR